MSLNPTFTAAQPPPWLISQAQAIYTLYPVQINNTGQNVLLYSNVYSKFTVQYLISSALNSAVNSGLIIVPQNLSNHNIQKILKVSSGICAITGKVEFSDNIRHSCVVCLIKGNRERFTNVFSKNGVVFSV